MKKLSILFLLISITQGVLAQDTTYQNTATTLINNSDRLSIRGYAEITFNQRFSSTTQYNGVMDLKRLVTFTGYKFNQNTSFITELEVEHGNEIYVEQAFLNHRMNSWLNFRAGLLLIPMGIVNEYHEPTTFNGVERPGMDSKIYPTTWRELGMGFQGVLPTANIAYQVYLVNGFKGYTKANGGIINETNGFRGGRQKGIKSMYTSPNFTSKIDYVGIRNLKIGISGYMGKTQSELFNNLHQDSSFAVAQADSSVVGLNMFGLDARYQWKNLRLRGQYAVGHLSNTEKYNAFTGSRLGDKMSGYYVEASYNVLPASSKYQLFPFVRYENYNTQVTLNEALNTNASEHVDLTCGVSFFLSQGAVLKADYQKLATGSNEINQFNLGVGIWF